jgi:hypothetical protein
MVKGNYFLSTKGAILIVSLTVVFLGQGNGYPLGELLLGSSENPSAHIVQVQNSAAKIVVVDEPARLSDTKPWGGCGYKGYCNFDLTLPQSE